MTRASSFLSSLHTFISLDLEFFFPSLKHQPRALRELNSNATTPKILSQVEIHLIGKLYAFPFFSFHILNPFPSFFALDFSCSGHKFSFDGILPEITHLAV